MGRSKKNVSVPVGVFVTLCKLKLSGTEYRTILCIIRNMYENNAKYCPLSLMYLSAELDTPKRNITRILNGLKKKGLITNYKTRSGTNDINLWGLSENFFTLPNIKGDRQ